MRITEIELLDKSFKLIRDGLIFGEVIHKEYVESFLQENERKINELQTENEELKQTEAQDQVVIDGLRNENERMKAELEGK